MLVQVQPLATPAATRCVLPDSRLPRAVPRQSDVYLGNLVGHEGEGSLLSRLKAEGLAQGLSAGDGLGWPGGALFSVVIALTEKGAADPDRVLQLLFAYTDMLRAEGPQHWLYAEQSRLADLSFPLPRAGAIPMGYVSALASGMQYYAPQDILRGPYLMDRYDAGHAWRNCWQQIRPD